MSTAQEWAAVTHAAEVQFLQGPVHQLTLSATSGLVLGTVSTRGWRWLIPQSCSALFASTPVEPLVRTRLCLPLPYGLITKLSSPLPFHPSQTDESGKMGLQMF